MRIICDRRFTMPSEDHSRLIDPEVEMAALFIHRAEYPFRVKRIALLTRNDSDLLIKDVAVHHTHLKTALMSSRLNELKLDYLPICNVGELFEILLINTTSEKRYFAAEIFVEEMGE